MDSFKFCSIYYFIFSRILVFGTTLHMTWTHLTPRYSRNNKGHLDCLFDILTTRKVILLLNFDFLFHIHIGWLIISEYCISTFLLSSIILTLSWFCQSDSNAIFSYGLFVTCFALLGLVQNVRSPWTLNLILSEKAAIEIYHMPSMLFFPSQVK